MADQTTNALLGISKTLLDIVAPAISANDPLAQQELRMAVRYLDFLRERVDHLYARARFELQFQAGLAATVGDRLRDCSRDGAASMQEAVERARALLDAPGATTDDLRGCSSLIAIALSDAVRDTAHDTARAAVERAVVEATETLTAFERSWYFPLGLDHFASEVAPLDTFLAATRPGDHAGA